MAGKGTPATALLAQRRVPHRIHTYEHDPRAESYGWEAAEALVSAGPERVVKTLVADVAGALTVAMIAITTELDLKALAAARDAKKASMAEVTAAERATGYIAGGISPLGQRRRLPTVLDTSVTGFETIFCSGGRRGLEIELPPSELVRLLEAQVAAIAKPSRSVE